MEPKYARHVKALFSEIEQLDRAADAVGSVVGADGWLTVGSMVDREVAIIDAQLDGERVLEHTEYARLHGKRAGLVAYRDLAFALLEHRRVTMEEQRAKHEKTAEPV